MQVTITLDTDALNPAQVVALSTLFGGVESTPKASTAKASTAKASTPKPEKTVSADADDEPTMKDAVDLATKLVSGGEAARVKEALAGVGAKRVSEIPEDKVGEFIASLS